jgi:hypothetical protein
MNRTLFAGAVVLTMAFYACKSNDKEEGKGPLSKLALELVDSLVVDEFSPLVMDDFMEEEGLFLLRGTKSRKPYLVNNEGDIVKIFEILNEGPDGLGSSGAFGYRFLDKNRWVAQGLFNGFHLYDMGGKKEKVIPPNNLGVFAMTVYTYRTTFNPYVKDGVPYMIGEEQNLYNPKEISGAELGADFYERVRTLYRYRLDNEEHELLETYPESWGPRRNERFVGASHPMVAYHKSRGEMAVLPVMGNELFVYDFSAGQPVMKHQVNLTHPYRPAEAPQIEGGSREHFSDYPSFTELRYCGEKILVGFHTRIPADVVKQLRAKSEQYYNTPEYKEAEAQYIKTYFLVVENGEQTGVLDKFPVPGRLDFTDDKGFLYVNDNVDPATERDYNVFYKIRIRK